MVRCNLLYLCIMKIDDYCEILLDEEEFSEYAATDESRRFIMSQFSFHSLYFYFFFSFPALCFFLLSHLAEIFAPLPIIQYNTRIGVQALVLRSARSSAAHQSTNSPPVNELAVERKK